MAGGSIGKRILRSSAFVVVASALIAFYIRLVRATSRFSTVGREHADGLLAEKGGFILAFWHSRLLMAPTIRRETDRPVHMLISSHRDGEVIARAVKGFGVRFIRGSAADLKKQSAAGQARDKSGAAAIAQMIAVLDRGDLVGMTPDGPTGPRQRAKIGVVKLAAFSGAPILPGAYSSSRGPALKTWDRFLLAGPFSKGVFVARPPIRVARDSTAEELEAARALLESELNLALDEADAAVGRQPAEPLAARRPATNRTECD